MFHRELSCNFHLSNLDEPRKVGTEERKDEKGILVPYFYLERLLP